MRYVDWKRIQRNNPRVYPAKNASSTGDVVGDKGGVVETHSFDTFRKHIIESMNAKADKRDEEMAKWIS